MKRAICAWTLLLALVCAVPAAAAFSQTQSYQGFSDVTSGDWSYSYIVSCNEMGLMSGTGGDRFSPKDPLSVGQIVTVAVRLHDLYQGGSGEISQEGEHWYDQAVQLAMEAGIIRPGQFDRYDRNATRAEVAGVLAAALPQSEYRAINTIASLPDVDSATPYSDAIFTLYRAGILTGGDAYGTYSPYEAQTRESLAAILCRLCRPETRMALTLAEKPKDLTVKSSSMVLFLNGVPMYGMVEIGGEYYVPLELFAGHGLLFSDGIRYWADIQTLDLNIGPLGSPTAVPDYKVATPAGMVLGTAAVGPSVSYEGENVSLLTLGGKFPMIRLSDLAEGGIQVQGNQVLADLPRVNLASAIYEEDLVGAALAGLLRQTPRDTVRAIHDYIVNTLTYDPYTEASEQALEAAAQRYQYWPNRTLASGYGVCQDYAELFQIMCLRAGIPCRFVTGTARGQGHAWNQVYLDGVWYYVDTTWDDPVGSTPVLNHDYFLVDADTMVKTHCWDDSDYPMPAEYDPAWEALDPNNITSADMFRKCLVAQMMQGNTTIRLRTTAAGAYGGVGCIYAYPMIWWQFSGGYDSASGCYVYHVVY